MNKNEELEKLKKTLESIGYTVKKQSDLSSQFTFKKKVPTDDKDIILEIYGNFDSYVSEK